MIFGNIKTFKNCGLCSTDLDKYLELLKGLDETCPEGRYELEDGAYYLITKSVLSAPEGKLYEAHRKYIDIQYIIKGKESMGYADINSVSEETPYKEDGDCALYKGNGTMLSFEKGDFAVFCPSDAHMPSCGEGESYKAIIKVPVK